jgi:arabinofuranosyltransferase
MKAVLTMLARINAAATAWGRYAMRMFGRRLGVLPVMSRVGVIAVFACLLFGAMSILDVQKKMTPDDTFITMQYAKHLSEGLGLRFNSADNKPEEGFSSVLHVVILTVGFLLNIDPLVFARIISLVSFLMIPVIIGFVCSRLAFVPLRIGLVAGFIGQMGFLFVPATALHLASGMETMLHTLTVAISICWVLSEIHPVSPFGIRGRVGFGLLAVLLPIFSRPEGVVFGVVCLMLVYMMRSFHGKSAKPEYPLLIIAAVFLLTLLIYIFWKKVYFGGILPNPYYVKGPNAIFGSGELTALPGLWHVKQFVTTFAPAILALVALMYILLKRIPSAVWFVIISCLPALMIVAMYSKAVHEMAFGFRYEYPYLVGLVVFVAMVTVYSFKRQRRVPYLLAIIVICFMVGANLFRHKDIASWLNYGTQNCDFAHASMGKDLGRTQLDKRAVILLSGAGAVPYFSQFTAIDWVGLNNGFFSGKDHREIDDLWRYIESRKPDVIYSIFPPASKRINTRDLDPAFNAAPVQASLRGFGCEMFKFWNTAKLADMFFREMLYIRDHCEFGGCYYLGYDQAWLIAYVRRDSLYKSRILECFRTSRYVDRSSDLKGVYINDPRQLGE